MRCAAAGLLLVLAVAGVAGAQTVSERLNDYPTAVRADYVFACMAANGQGQDVLRKCACSIDHIASVLPYAAYVEAETVRASERHSRADGTHQ